MNFEVKFIPSEPEIISNLETNNKELELINEYAIVEMDISRVITTFSNKTEAYCVCKQLNDLSHRRYCVFNSREPSLYKEDKHWTLIDSIQSMHKNFHGSIHEAIVEAGYLNNAMVKDRYP